MKSLVLLGVAVLSAGTVAAGDPAVGVFSELNGDYRRIGAELRLAPMWQRDWGAWHAGVNPQFEVSRFRYTGRVSGPDRMNQAGAIAMFRTVYGDGGFRPYGELGLGAALFSRTELGAREFSTAFQFSRHAGLGIEFGGRFTAGWRYSHYSNANIKTPNNGIDLHHLVLGMSF